MLLAARATCTAGYEYRTVLVRVQQQYYCITGTVSELYQSIGTAAVFVHVRYGRDCSIATVCATVQPEPNIQPDELKSADV